MFKNIKPSPILANASVFLLLILFILNWVYPFIRFSNHYINWHVPLFLAAILMVLSVMNGFYLSGARSKWIAVPGVLFHILFFFFLAAFLFFSSIFTLPSSTKPEDSPFEVLYETKKNIKIYRTNFGATTSYGIVVRQEKPLMPGLIRVKQFFIDHRMDNIKYAWRDDTLILSNHETAEVLKEIKVK